MPPPAAQTFALDSASRSLGGAPSPYALDRSGWRRIQPIIGVAYLAMGAGYLLLADHGVFTGCAFLVIGVLQIRQVTGLLKRPVGVPTVTLDGDGVRYGVPTSTAEQHAPWADIASVRHGAGRLVLARHSDALPIVVSFADVTYGEAQAIKEAADAWAHHKRIPLL